MSFNALINVTSFDHTTSDDLTERLFGRDNFVEMELYQAMSLMTDTQKRILNDMIDLGGQISLFRIALGEGREKPGTIGLCVSRDVASVSAHIEITPRGAVTGTIFPEVWADDDRRVEVKSFAGLVEQYTRMGLYEWNRLSSHPDRQ